MSEYRQLELTDLQVSACSRWRDPAGREFLELPNMIPFFRVVPGGASLFDVELGIPAEFDFLCKAIGAVTDGTIGMVTRIQWPDSRYLQASPIDFQRFCRTGKRGRLIDPHKLCEKGQKIRLSLDNTANEEQVGIELYFEGVLRIPMVHTTKGSNGRNCILG
jgi:hypothetical protein